MKSQPNKPIITTDDVRAAQASGSLTVPPDAIITEVARELAASLQIKIATQADATETNSGEMAVALGSDHGGSFTMKEALKPVLAEWGYRIIDCGTYSPDSVDYPDIAYAVAKHVANGSAWRGIIIDGAGIGSSMAANKVPGVRAALCYNTAMAHNSREHNDANVLTLGAGMIGLNLAQQIIKTWLTTEFGGGRHARRVNKIIDIEHRFLKG